MTRRIEDAGVVGIAPAEEEVETTEDGTVGQFQRASLVPPGDPYEELTVVHLDPGAAQPFWEKTPSYRYPLHHKEATQLPQSQRAAPHEPPGMSFKGYVPKPTWMVSVYRGSQLLHKSDYVFSSKNSAMSIAKTLCAHPWSRGVYATYITMAQHGSRETFTYTCPQRGLQGVAGAGGEENGTVGREPEPITRSLEPAPAPEPITRELETPTPDPYSFGERAGSLEPWQKISILKPQYARQTPDVAYEASAVDGGAPEDGNVGVQRVSTPSSWYPRVKQLMLESMPHLGSQLGAQSATMPGAWQYLPSYPFTQASMPVEGLGAQRLYTPAAWLPQVKAMSHQRVGVSPDYAAVDPWYEGTALTFRPGSRAPYENLTVPQKTYFIEPAFQMDTYQQAAPQNVPGGSQPEYVTAEPWYRDKAALTFREGAPAPTTPPWQAAQPLTAQMQVTPQTQAVQMSTPQQAAPQNVPSRGGGGGGDSRSATPSRTGQSLILPKRAASEFSHASASRYPFAWAAIGQSLLEYKTTQPSYLPGQQKLVEHVTHSEPTGPQPSQYARQITATAPSAPAYQQAALQTPQAPQASRVAPPAAQAARQMQQPAFSAVTPASASRGSQQVSPRVGQGLVEDRILPPQGQGEFVDAYYLEQFRRQKSALRGPAGISDGLADLAGPSGTLGEACPYLVKRWFNEVCPDWGQASQEEKDHFINLANEKEGQFKAAVNGLRGPTSCDASVPGELAGQLREYLIEQGADEADLGEEKNTFGPKEMKAWLALFNEPPTWDDAKKAVGTTWFGGKPISLTTLCPNGGKMPLAPVTPGPAPPPPPTTKVAKKKKSKAGWLLLAGSAVTALFYAMK